MSAKTLSGVLKGCEEIINEISHFSPSSLPDESRISELIHLLNEKISSNAREENVEKVIDNKKLFRFTHEMKIDEEKNTSEEKILEKNVVINDSEQKWANQVPVASGLSEPNNDRKRAIDLVYRISEKEFDFIELKVFKSAGVPFSAAAEIISYGLIYLWYRKHAENRASQDMLKAERINLIVLGPDSDYYDSSTDNYRKFEEIASRALQSISKEQNCEMNFFFQKFTFIKTNNEKDKIEKNITGINNRKRL
jgi:hypothetical protein